MLNLPENSHTGGLPSTLPPALKELNLQKNHYSGPIRDAYGASTRLRLLDVSSNILSGTLLGTLLWNDHPTELFLTFNEFDGWLPNPPDDWIDGTSTLEVLYVDENKFDGGVSNIISNLLSLRSLQMDNNLFSGSLPSVTSPVLTVFNMYNNRLTGAMPSVLLWSSHMTQLECSHNYLNGALPEAPPGWPANASALTDFNVEVNFLSGSMPDSLYLLGKLT